MKEPTRRRSSRKSKEHVDNTSPYTGRSRRSKSANKDTFERRRSSRNASANENASQRKRKLSSSSASEERPKVRKRMVNGRVIDSYCWVCHKVGSESICNSCPRVYHQHCLKKIKGNSNQTPICECYLKRVDGRNEDLDLQNLELKILLQAVMREAVKESKKISHKREEPNQQNNKFCHLFQNWAVENDMLCKIMDLNIIIDTMNGESIQDKSQYSSTGQFFLDIKWIYHNCCILYGFDSEITEVASKLEKNFKRELVDMEACPECYSNAYADKYPHAAFFAKICTNDHPIIWAQLRGSPYWPAKLMNMANGHAEVKFFGTHDKANILIKKCLKISKDPPMKKSISQVKFQVAQTELSMYVTNYEAIKEKAFPYYAPDTPLEDNYVGAKKRYRKNQRRRVTSAKGVSEKEISDNPGTGAEPDAGTRSTEAQEEHDSGTRSMGFGTPEDSSENFFLGDTKVKCIRSFVDNRSNWNMAESVGGPISDHSKVMCEMTFTAEHNEPISELNSECVDSSTSHYSSSQAPLNHNLFSITENPNMCSASDLSSSGEFVTSTGVEQNPIDFVDINALSVYNSVESSSEIPSTAISSNLNMPNNLPVITSVSACENSDYIAENIFPHEQTSVGDLHNNSSLGITEPSGIISNENLNFLFEYEDNENNDDDVQVINEKKKKASAQQYLMNDAVLKAIIEVLCSSRPQMREQLRTLGNFTILNYLVMWLEISSAKFDNQDLRVFNDTCRRYVKQLNSLEAAKSKLENKVQMLTDEVQMLKDKVKRMENNSHNKIPLRDNVIQALGKKMVNDHKAKIEELEANMEQLKNSKEQLTAQVESFNTKLKDAENEIDIKDVCINEQKKLIDNLEKCLKENSRAVTSSTTQTEGNFYDHYEKRIHESDSVPASIQSQDSAQLIRNNSCYPAEMAASTGVMIADSRIQQPLKQQGRNVSDSGRSIYLNPKNQSRTITSEKWKKSNT